MINILPCGGLNPCTDTLAWDQVTLSLLEMVSSFFYIIQGEASAVPGVARGDELATVIVSIFLDALASLETTQVSQSVSQSVSRNFANFMLAAISQVGSQPVVRQ